MLLRRRLKKVLFGFLALLLILVTGVFLLFKAGKLMELVTPAEPVVVAKVDTTTNIHLVSAYMTEQEPEGFAILVTDAAHRSESEALATALARQRIVTTFLDFDLLRQQLAEKPASSDCHYLSDDLKDAAEAMQRKLHMKRYFFPVIIGLGDASPLAYAVVAQAPRNTLAGAISIGFSDKLKSDRPYCPGAAMTALGNEEYRIGNDKELPADWYAIVSSADQAKADDFQNALNQASSIAANGDKAIRKAVIGTAQELQRQEEQGVQNLPVALIRPEGPAKALIIIISGDGGWRDIDKTIGEHLAAKGIAVVGIDALRYFWSRREPAIIADDLELLLTVYGKEFKTDTYALAGYSFGANVIPFAWPLMDKPIRKQVKLVSLLGLAPNTDFEISAEGYLGSNSDQAEAVKPLLSRLPLAKTQCFYGEDELQDDSTACTLPELDKAERIKTSGGHHFDGDYKALADKIAQRLLAQ